MTLRKARTLPVLGCWRLRLSKVDVLIVLRKSKSRRLLHQSVCRFGSGAALPTSAVILERQSHVHALAWQPTLTDSGISGSERHTGRDPRRPLFSNPLKREENISFEDDGLRTQSQSINFIRDKFRYNPPNFRRSCRSF